MPRISLYPESPSALDADDLIIEADADGATRSLKVAALGVDRRTRFELRDDFVPALPLATYVDSLGAFVATDTISDAAGEGFGFRNLSAAAASAADVGDCLAGGADVVARARFRIVSTVANMATLAIGLLESGGSGFGIFLGMDSGGYVGAILTSVAGGVSVDLSDGATAPTIGQWYEVEVRTDWTNKTASLYVDGVAVVEDVDVTSALPEATEVMGLGYATAPSAGTAEFDLDYVEVRGDRV